MLPMTFKIKRKIHQEKRQFTQNEPICMKTTNIRIELDLEGENFKTLLDTGSDICSMHETLSCKMPDYVVCKDFHATFPEQTLRLKMNS